MNVDFGLAARLSVSALLITTVLVMLLYALIMIRAVRAHRKMIETLRTMLNYTVELLKRSEENFRVNVVVRKGEKLIRVSSYPTLEREFLFGEAVEGVMRKRATTYFETWQPTERGEGYTSVLSVPIRKVGRKKPVGVLMVELMRPRHQAVADFEELARKLGDIAVIADKVTRPKAEAGIGSSSACS